MLKIVLSLSLLSISAVAADTSFLPIAGTAPLRVMTYECPPDLATTNTLSRENAKLLQLQSERANLYNIKLQSEAINTKVNDYIILLSVVEEQIIQMNSLLTPTYTDAANPQLPRDQEYLEKLGFITSSLQQVSNDERNYGVFSDISVLNIKLPSVNIASITLPCLDSIWTTLQGTTINSLNTSKILSDVIQHTIPYKKRELQDAQKVIDTLLDKKQSRILELEKAIKDSISLQQRYLKNLQESFTIN